MQFYRKRKRKLAFKPDGHLAHGLGRSEFQSNIVVAKRRVNPPLLFSRLFTQGHQVGCVTLSYDWNLPEAPGDILPVALG